MDKAIELDLFSTTPEEQWREDQGLRDYVAEKGLTSLCWVCVGVLEAKMVLVLVHQLSISLSQLLDGLINPNLLA